MNWSRGSPEGIATGATDSPCASCASGSGAAGASPPFSTGRLAASSSSANRGSESRAGGGRIALRCGGGSADEPRSAGHSSSKSISKLDGGARPRGSRDPGAEPRPLGRCGAPESRAASQLNGMPTSSTGSRSGARFLFLQLMMVPPCTDAPRMWARRCVRETGSHAGLRQDAHYRVVGEGSDRQEAHSPTSMVSWTCVLLIPARERASHPCVNALAGETVSTPCWAISADRCSSSSPVSPGRECIAHTMNTSWSGTRTLRITPGVQRSSW